MIKIEIIIGYALQIKTKKSIFFSKDQCPSIEETSAHFFEPLVDPFGPGPPTHGQSGLSGLVVGGQKMHDSHAPSDSKKNACQDQAKNDNN